MGNILFCFSSENVIMYHNQLALLNRSMHELICLDLPKLKCTLSLCAYRAQYLAEKVKQFSESIVYLQSLDIEIIK